MNKEDAGLCKDQPGELHEEPTKDERVLVLFDMGGMYRSVRVEAVFPYPRELEKTEWDDLQTLCDDLGMGLFIAPLMHETDALEYLSFLVNDRAASTLAHAHELAEELRRGER